MISRKTLICGLIGGIAIAGFSQLSSMAGDKLGPGTYAEFDTSEGNFTCKLYSKESPKTVANFVALSQGTKEWTDPSGQKSKKPLYNGTIFHRVIDGFMIQGGDPQGNGRGGPGYKFEDEFNEDFQFTKPGVLAMANSGPNTNGSQFFVTLGTPGNLTGGHVNPALGRQSHHTIFGEVVSGMDVVQKIGHTKTAPGDRPVKDVVIKEIKIQKI